MPRAGSSSPIAFQADGIKAQSPATLRSTRGFSASAANSGFLRTRCKWTVLPSRTNCVGTTTGTSRWRPAATRWPKLLASTKGRHSASPRVASTGAVYIPRVWHSGRGFEFLDRLGPMTRVVDLAVGGAADGVDHAHPAGGLVVGEPLLDVRDDLGFNRRWRTLRRRGSRPPARSHPRSAPRRPGAGCRPRRHRAPPRAS